MIRLPKVELHLHLDCSLSYSAVSRLRPSITRAEYRKTFIAPPRCTSLAGFLTRAPHGFQLLQDAAALTLAVEDLFEQLAADNIIYAEIRFAPLLHTANGLTAEAAISAVDRAVEACIRATGIQARVILCTLRHFNKDESLETARFVERFQGSRVVALDLAADEAGFSIDAHVPAFHHALDRGLHRTAHAGEARGPASVWETLRAFQPTRIGHGVRSVEDPALLQHLTRHRIHLEVCPTSNVQTCVCPSYQEHPLPQLLDAGVSLGISTDARTISNITLNEEYRRLEEAFGWGAGEFYACNREALSASFVDDDIKNDLSSRLDAAYVQNSKVHA